MNRDLIRFKENLWESCHVVSMLYFWQTIRHENVTPSAWKLPSLIFYYNWNFSLWYSRNILWKRDAGSYEWAPEDYFQWLSKSMRRPWNVMCFGKITVDCSFETFVMGLSLWATQRYEAFFFWPLWKQHVCISVILLHFNFFFFSESPERAVQ